MVFLPNTFNISHFTFSSDNQSFLYSLPKEISTTLNRGDNTQNNSADVQIKGGGKKKKRKASSSKKKTKNSRV